MNIDCVSVWSLIIQYKAARYISTGVGSGGGGGGQGGHVPPHFFDRGGNGMFVPPHF